MTEQEAIQEIENKCHSGDKEMDHSRADEVLCDFLKSLGFFDLVEAWEKVDKWYA